MTSNSRYPKPPPTSNRHSYVDRRDPPEPPGSHRRRPGPDRARAPRVGVHGRQPAIRLPRLEARDVRRPRTLARGAPRVDQGRRRAGFLHARSVGLESAPELFRRAVVLGVCCAPAPSLSVLGRYTDKTLLSLNLSLTTNKGRLQSYPSSLLVRCTTAGPRTPNHGRRRAPRPSTPLALARALPFIPLFDGLHRVHLGEQIPARLHCIPFARLDVRPNVDACLGGTAQLDRREK